MKKEKFSAKKEAISFLLFSLVFILLVSALYFTFAFFRDRQLTLPSAQIPNNLPTIIIDPGHGGIDGGAVGGQLIEKDLNLDIALSLRDMLKSKGYEVILTRESDVMLSDAEVTSSKKASDLSARLKIMKNTENAVFVSIHMNAFSDKRYGGLQVYYSANDKRSRSLALLIQDKAVLELQPQNTRKIKEAGENIYLLNRATCPAVLIECGFLSNAGDCTSLASESYRQRLAEVLADSIEFYISENH